MESALICDIKKFAVHDGDGIRTTVFLKGCPLKCVWCHNPESISLKPQTAYYRHKCVNCGECVKVCTQKAHSVENGIHTYNHRLCTGCGKCEEVCIGNALKNYGKKMSIEELLPILLEDREFYSATGGGVTISGGECLLHADFCEKLLKELKKENIHTAVDTCGFVSKEAIDKVFAYTDVFLYDLKAIDEEVHIRCTGQTNKIILDNLKYIDSIGGSIEIRIPYVPDYNSGEMEKIREFLESLQNIGKVRVLAYHNYAASKYEALNMDNTLPENVPSEEVVNKVQEFMVKANNITTGRKPEFLLHSLIADVSDFEIHSKNKSLTTAEKLKNFLDRNLHNRLLIKNCCDFMCMGKSQMLKIFRKAYGISPMEYHRNEKIRDSQTLLVHTDLSVSEIAAKYSFNSVYHYSKTFKAVVGMSPSEYRKLNKKIM